MKVIAAMWPYLLLALAVTGLLYQFVLARP